MPLAPTSAPAETPARKARGFSPRSWAILLVATISSGLTGPGQTIGVSVFIDYFVSDLDLTRSQVASAYLVGTLAGATFLPSVGRLIDSYGVRKSQILIGLVFGLALANMSMVNGLLWLAIGFFGIRLTGQGSLSLVSTLTVSLHFVKRRGTALGIFATASGALMSLVPVCILLLINQWGWRTAWVLVAGTVSTLVVCLAFFGLRGLPTGSNRRQISNSSNIDLGQASATSGQHADQTRLDNDSHSGGADHAVDPETVDLETVDVEAVHVETTDAVDTKPTAGTAPEALDRRQAIRMRSFWILAVVSGSTSMLGTALNFHQIDLLGDAGLSAETATIMFLPQVIGSAIAGLAVGYVSDNIGTRYLPAFGMVLLMMAHWVAAAVEPGLTVVVYAILLGGMAGTVRTSTTTLLANWFGTSNLGSIQGLLTFFTVGASAIGPVALAQLENGLGSYPPALLTLSVIPAAAAVFSLTRHTMSGQ